MPKEFTVYGSKIVVSDDFDVFNSLRQKFIAEAQKASSTFMTKYQNYRDTVSLLNKGYEDGRSIILEVIQRVIISEIFIKAKVYDLDINRFCQEFYKCPWGSVLQQLISKYEELSKAIDSMIGVAEDVKERYDGIRNKYQKSYNSMITQPTISEALSSGLFGKYGMSERNRRNFEFWEDALNEHKERAEAEISEATDRAKKLQQMQDSLYTSQEVQAALQDEMFNSVAELWLSCWRAMEKYGLVHSDSILLLNGDNIKNANSIVNNMPYMDKNDILERLPSIFLSNPYNEDLYVKLFGIFGDSDGSLGNIASYFGFSNTVKNLLAEERRRAEEARREAQRRAEEEARKEEERKIAEEERKQKSVEALFGELTPEFCKSRESSAVARKRFIAQSLQIGFTREQVNDFLAKKVEQEQRFAESSPAISIILGILTLFLAFYSSGMLRWVSGSISFLFLIWSWVVSSNKKDAVSFLENWDHDDALGKNSNVLLEKEDSTGVQPITSHVTTHETNPNKSSLLIILIVIGILALPFMLIKIESSYNSTQKSNTMVQVKERRASPLRQVEAQRQVEVQRQNYESDYAKGVEYLNAKDYSLALGIFRRLANDGYAPAQDKLAWMYQNGWGVEQSYSQAVNWFRKAAEQGNTEALASMGLMYLKGWGVPQNYDTALEWYGKAAAQGSEVAQRRINSIQLLKVNKQKISSIERGTGFPISGTIFAETLSVRQSPNTSSKRIKTLKTGHPVSISRAVDSDNDYWFYVKTASGTEGWVLGGYVNLIDRDLSYQETTNKKHTLPASGYVTTREDSLNLRNIPTVKGSQVVEKLNSGTYFTAYEVFAGDTIDWYRIRTTEGDEGWVSGKYIELNY